MESETEGTTLKVRDYRESPFAYQDKPALRAIRQRYLDGKIDSRTFRSLRSLYCALSELAVVNGHAYTTASNETLSRYGSASGRSLSMHLKMLANLGLISIDRAAHGPRTIQIRRDPGSIAIATEDSSCFPTEEHEVYICPYCGGRGSEDLGPDGRQWHIDHLYPHSRCGDSGPDNLVRACATCNLKKSGMLLTAFLSNSLMWRKNAKHR